ncbi:MAG: phosphatidylserine/phosphatidylglycerophosphate/cardiolipin synthase family protein [Candidatus Riflebacteria bacterium]|nr:phosphatidylserine/phosphatidylglycerophosphate/cardiolipin synthase family protein [Candidatus Riflebacteria bacterium]
MKIMRFAAMGIMLGSLSGTCFGSESLQSLQETTQKKYADYNKILGNSTATVEQKIDAAKAYAEAKAAYETARNGNSQVQSVTPGSEMPASQPLSVSNESSVGTTIDKVVNQATIKEEDLDVKFPATNNNSLQLKMGEDFWQNVTKDIQNASSSIHIQMFGMEGDKTGWEFAKLLAAKAKSGVEVCIVADRSGARMEGLKNIYKNTEEEKLFKFYKDNGVKVVFYDRISRGTSLVKKLDFFHFDHRKMFIIDGKNAYSGGYTLQQPSREAKHDMMVNVQGSIVGQMEASYLLNFRYNGGTLAAKSREEVVEKYFPEPENNGSANASLMLNIPRGRHELTDTYLSEIDAAKNYLYIINPYITNDEMVAKICNAAKRKVRVDIVVPGSAENPLNDMNMRGHFEEMLKAGVKIHLYQGEKKLGKLHAKGLIRDDEFVSIGSCNMDTMALHGNYEQNIVSRDKTFVQKVRRDLFEKDFTVSTLYQPPTSWLERMKIKLKGNATQLLDRVD